ncbi:hypothetical protein BG011_003693 [Mortierella polycephala]|uniref:Uncharacterized protein n=1 Tax=Mortierella polycephala TaxID=41804 RepID=A0A9P6U2M9_9FUNG|nr:hypothetical protein BG011_003693 [Mortierella polycephala]
MAPPVTSPMASPGQAVNKAPQQSSPSPTPAISPVTVVHTSVSKDLDRDQVHHHGSTSSNGEQQQSYQQHPPTSPSFTRHSPGSGGPAQQPINEHHQHQYQDEHRPYPPHAHAPSSAPAPEHGAKSQWHPGQESDPSYADPIQRYPPQSSPYQQESPYYNAPPSSWNRGASPSAVQGANKHLSFTRHGSALRPRSPPYPLRSSHAEINTQRPPHSGGAHPAMPPSPVATRHSPESYPTKRQHADSDSEGYSDHRSYQYSGGGGPNNGKPQEYSDPSRGYPPHHPSSYPASVPLENLPALAPRPHRYSMEEDGGPNTLQHQPHSATVAATQVKKETAPTQAPFRIQSARGTPKGPLPIEVQISLLSSVLRHDPFNCPIRKTTQAWESISREQHIRARTCSRRFDNIIQASIAGRDRPVGTEEQQATKKKLLEQLFEMMNQPQALKRMQKKRRYRSEDTDRRLLLETIRLNPFAQKVGQVAKAWEDVRDALKMKVHARQCIRRVNRMVKPYQLRERMYKGNIPEDMREANDDLVKEVIQLMRNAGQGSSLDEGCNSNDEDSASCMSDSDEREDPYMDSKGQENAQEDDELEEDEDEDMVPRSESEQRHAQKKREEDSQSGPITPRSPGVQDPHSPSNHPANSGPSPTSATPAKRGRPRNPVHMLQPDQNANQDRARHLMRDTHDANVSRHRVWDGELSEAKDDRMSNDVGFAGQGHGFQSTPLSSPLHVHSPTRVPPHGPNHARHFSHGAENIELGDYKRPSKHPRTDSRGMHEMPVDLVRNDKVRAFSPGRHGSHPNHHNRERGPVLDSHGRPIPPPLTTHEQGLDGYGRRGHTGAIDDMSDPSTISPPTVQQYSEVLNELHIMRDYLAQMDEHRRMEKERQGSLMYTIEKLQHQMQQQQQQLSQLQQQLRYGYQSQPSQQSQQQPPPLSPHHAHHHHPHVHGPPPSSQAPPSGGPPSGGRYPPRPNDHHIPARSTDRPPADMTFHSSYSRQDGAFPPRDRDLR